MKKIFRALSLFAICAAIVAASGGCQQKEAPSGASAPAPAQTPAPSAPAAPEAKPITLKIAHVQSMTHPYTQGVKDIGKTLTEKTGGRLILEDYPASQLGSEKDTADSVANDVLEMAIISPAEIAKRYKPALIFDIPYVFRDVDHAMKVINGPIGQEMWDEFATSTNIRVVTSILYGSRHITSSRPIHTPADLKGFKLRVTDTPVGLATGKALGANPTPMAFSEVYLGLSQGVVDGQENPIPTIIASKFYEVQKYLILSGHVLQTNQVTISDKKLKALPADLQASLFETFEAGAKELTNVIVKAEADGIEELKKNGVEVITPDMEAFREAGKAVVAQFQDQWGEGLYEKIQAVQ